MVYKIYWYDHNETINKPSITANSKEEAEYIAIKMYPEYVYTMQLCVMPEGDD